MFLLKNFHKNKNSIITEKNEIISYGDLFKKVNNFSKNIKKRNLAFLLCQNNLETIVGYLGLIKSDCVISMIDQNISFEMLERLISIYKPNYIFLDKSYTDYLHISISLVR